jgi:uncharacterized membrane protein YheB (UPF0754 family)
MCRIEIKNYSFQSLTNSKIYKKLKIGLPELLSYILINFPSKNLYEITITHFTHVYEDCFLQQLISYFVDQTLEEVS